VKHPKKQLFLKNDRSVIEQKLEKSKNKLVTEGDIKKTETIRSGCEIKIIIEGSFLSKSGFFSHEGNIDLNLQFRAGITNMASQPEHLNSGLELMAAPL